MVLTFWSNSDMLATMHLFTVAMVWHHEPIEIHVCPPRGTQVREYMASRGRHPSGTQVPIMSGEVVPQFSSIEPKESQPPTS